MKKIGILYLICYCLISCIGATEDTSKKVTMFVDLDLKCKHAYFLKGNEGVDLVFEIEYDNQSDATLFLDDTEQMVYSREAEKESKGFVFVNTAKKKNILLSNFVVEHYTIFQPHTKKIFYLYMTNIYEFESLQGSYLKYNGGDLTIARIVKHQSEDNIIINKSNIMIPLDGVILKEITVDEAIQRHMM